MKTKIVLLAITTLLLSACGKAQLPIYPGTPGQVLTSNGGPFNNPYWSNGGVTLLDTVTLELNTTAYQGIKLLGYNTATYGIQNIIVTNATGTPIAAKGGEWWTQKGHAGVEVARTLKQVTSVFTYLTSDTAFIDRNMSSLITVYPAGHPFLQIRDSLYFNCDTANSAAVQVKMFIYGFKIN